MITKFLLPIVPLTAFSTGVIANSVTPYADTQNSKINISNSYSVTSNNQELVKDKAVFSFKPNNENLYDSLWFDQSVITMQIPSVPVIKESLFKKIEFKSLREQSQPFYFNPSFSSADKGSASITTMLSLRKTPENYEIILNIVATHQLVGIPAFNVNLQLPNFSYTYKG